MRRELRLLGLVAAAALLAGCPGGEAPPLRIGVIVDCVGIYRSLEAAELSGAALPLVERGARLEGRRLADGLSPARVAGRDVEIVRGCTEAFEFSTLTSELRRLAEREHTDVVVAAGNGVDEVVLRDVARDHPDTVFVAVAHGPREATLARPAPNLFRFAADHGQGVAGLADYAYHRLGWRRVAVVLGAWDTGWGGRDAFTAEFCALGGRVASHLAVPQFDPAGRDAERVPRDVDGVAVFASSFFGPAAFMRRLARRLGDPARRIVVGPGLVDDPALLRATGASLAGVVGSSSVDRARMRAYLTAFAHAFPGVPSRVAGAEPVSGYRDAVEGVLRAFERAGGDPERLPAQLARLRADLTGGPVRLDANRQAVVSTSLVRIGGEGAPAVEPVRTITGVDQSVGGLLPAAARTGEKTAACRRGQPPPWAG